MIHRILIATGIYPPDIGGPATYTVFLERLLTQHGFSADVCTFTRVRKFPKIIRHILYFVLLMKKGVASDGLYALDTVSVGVPACIASVLLRKPLYLRVPGDYAWEQGQQRYGITETLDEYATSSKRYPFQVRLLAWLERQVATHARRIVVPSEYMRRVVERWGVPPQKITRIYSALSPIQFTEPREVCRAKYMYENFVVTTAARLVPWKGMRVLIETIVKMRGEGVSVSLEIIGEGPERSALEKSIVEHDAGTYIHLVGQVGKSELWERIYASDVFVLNTSYEGLSHQLIEVMDIGTPIITTPVGGNTELITNEETGLLTPFNNREILTGALQRMCMDTHVRDVCVKNAREKAKLFREESIIPEVVALFHE